MPKATGNILAITLALTISGVCPGSAAQTPLDLVVQLENHAGLVSPVLADAEQLAGAVFAQIGVRLRWQEKADQTNRAEEPDSLSGSFFCPSRWLGRRFGGKTSRMMCWRRRPARVAASGSWSIDWK